MTVEKFLADGYKFVVGDICLHHDGDVVTFKYVNDWNDPLPADDNRYVLRAAALEDTPTETPEEKEVLDSIESVGEVEWDGESLPSVGVECEALFIDHEHKGYGEFLVLGYHSNYVWVEYIGKLRNKSKHYTAKINMVKFRKPETPQQREDRERLEAAYDLYLDFYQDHNPCHETIESFECSRDKDLWLRTVRKTNYRKEKTNGTN